MKTKLHFLCLALVLLVGVAGFSQTVYLNTDLKKIYRINDDSSITLITTTDIVLTDIAIDTNGNFYGITDDGKIVSIDMQTGLTSLLVALPTIPSHATKSLVCNYQNELFFLDNYQSKLYKYVIATNTLSVVATVSSTPGDLTFYKGNLIFPVYTFSDESWIKAYDLQTGLIHTIFDFPENNNFFWFFGITNRYTSCGENQIIGWNEYMKQYNLESNTTTPLLVDTFTNGNFMRVNGLASDNEYLASNPECYEALAPLTVPEHSLNSIGLFPNPVKNTFSISGTKQVLGVELYSSNGQKLKTFTAVDRTFPISEFANGIYIVKILTAEGSTYKKLVKN